MIERNKSQGTIQNSLVVKDLSGRKYYFHSADVCCGKALLIGCDDGRFYIRAITELSCV